MSVVTRASLPSLFGLDIICCPRAIAGVLCHKGDRLGHDQQALGAHVGGAVCIAALFAGLLSGGANDALLTAGFSFWLCLLATARFLLEPRVAGLLGRYWIELAGAAGFVAWAALGCLRVGAPLVHPIWSGVGEQGGSLSVAPYRAVEGITQFACAMAAFGLGALAGRRRASRDWAARALVVGAVLYAGYALILYWRDPAASDGRLMANLGSANSACLTFVILGSVCLAQVARAIGAGPRRTWLGPLVSAPLASVGVAASFMCIFLSASRAGILCAFVAYAVFFFLIILVRRGAAQRLAPLAALLVVLTVAGGASFALDRLPTLSSDAIQRETVHEVHWAVFMERPLLGHGINTFHELNAHYATPESFAALESVGSAHQIYIQALEEGGLIGFTLLTLCLLSPLARAARTVFARESGGEWAAAVIASACAILLHGFVDFGLQVPAIAALFSYMMGAFAGGRRPMSKRGLPFEA